MALPSPVPYTIKTFRQSSSYAMLVTKLPTKIESAPDTQFRYVLK